MAGNSKKTTVNQRNGQVDENSQCATSSAF